MIDMRDNTEIADGSRFGHARIIARMRKKAKESNKIYFTLKLYFVLTSSHEFLWWAYHHWCTMNHPHLIELQKPNQNQRQIFSTHLEEESRAFWSMLGSSFISNTEDWRQKLHALISKPEFSRMRVKTQLFSKSPEEVIAEWVLYNALMLFESPIRSAIVSRYITGGNPDWNKFAKQVLKLTKWLHPFKWFDFDLFTHRLYFSLFINYFYESLIQGGVFLSVYLRISLRYSSGWIPVKIRKNSSLCSCY